jgi:hypothetical protein
MNESDPHFRIGALTEALESAKKRCERHMASMPAEAQYVLKHLIDDIEGSLRRDRARVASAVTYSGEEASTSFHRWLEHVKQPEHTPMKAKIESTDQIVDIQAVGHPGMTKARVWEGVTEAGVQFTAYIPMVQVLKADDCQEFERDLVEHKRAQDWVRRAIDFRMVL